MAVNKLALLRYKTIDECLKNRRRKWTLEDLIDKVSDALYEYEGIRTGISKRSIQGDIQVMRSDKLGYNAPIVVVDRRYYTYEDSQYSITKSPLNNTEVEKIKEIVSLLKQFTGFNHFNELDELVTKLDNTVQKSNNPQRNFIQVETNDLLKGKEFITPLYHAISNQKSLLIEYQSFKAQKPEMYIYYPYLLKEFRNRWFLICKKKKRKDLMNLALDRILTIQELENEKFEEYTGIDFNRYYDDIIGVTKSEKDRARGIVLEIDNLHTPYVLTKPMHHSQKVLKTTETTTIIRIDVCINYELEKEILSFGEFVKVLSPVGLKKRMENRIVKMKELYVTEI